MSKWEELAALQEDTSGWDCSGGARVFWGHQNSRKRFFELFKCQVTAFAPFRTDFLRDMALLEMTEDLVELVLIEFAIWKIFLNVDLLQSNL